MRCCVGLGIGTGCDVSTRLVMGAGEVYVAVNESVKRIIFIVFGFAILL